MLLLRLHGAVGESRESKLQNHGLHGAGEIGDGGSSRPQVLLRLAEMVPESTNGSGLTFTLENATFQLANWP